VDTAPLPARAQFLNVIESIFSGMARATIHNSNYQSVTEAKAAIDPTLMNAIAISANTRAALATRSGARSGYHLSSPRGTIAKTRDTSAHLSEPPRVCRRLFRLSHAAMAGCSIMA
jgi:hypothetical protein